MIILNAGRAALRRQILYFVGTSKSFNISGKDLGNIGQELETGIYILGSILRFLTKSHTH